MTGDEYQRTAKALARETTIDPTAAARIEQNLVSAMTSRDAGQPGPRWRRRLGGRSKTRWAAAAAVLVIAASVFAWRINRPTSGTNTAHTAPPSVVLPAVPPLEPIATAAKVVTASAPVRQATARKALPKSRVIRPAGFVELPWSAGLPAFESGEIVRMEVSVASLPAYGIDISSGAGDRPVEADLLIGQDGLARAIRLVKSTARSTQ